MAAQVHRALCISRRVAPIAAAHGAANRVNTMNAYALTGEKYAPIEESRLGSPSATFPKPRTIPKVATIVSFAKSPVIVATATSHVPNPSGANSGAMNRPSEARILSCVSTIWNDQLVDCNIQITAEATAMIVPALDRKSVV